MCPTKGVRLDLEASADGRCGAGGVSGFRQLALLGMSLLMAAAMSSESIQLGKWGEGAGGRRGRSISTLRSHCSAHCTFHERAGWCSGISQSVTSGSPGVKGPMFTAFVLIAAMTPNLEAARVIYPFRCRRRCKKVILPIMPWLGVAARMASSRRVVQPVVFGISRGTFSIPLSSSRLVAYWNDLNRSRGVSETGKELVMRLHARGTVSCAIAQSSLIRSWAWSPPLRASVASIPWAAQHRSKKRA